MMTLPAYVPVWPPALLLHACPRRCLPSLPPACAHCKPAVCCRPPSARGAGLPRLGSLPTGHRVHMDSAAGAPLATSSRKSFGGQLLPAAGHQQRQQQQPGPAQQAQQQGSLAARRSMHAAEVGADPEAGAPCASPGRASSTQRWEAPGDQVPFSRQSSPTPPLSAAAPGAGGNGGSARRRSSWAGLGLPAQESADMPAASHWPI